MSVAKVLFFLFAFLVAFLIFRLLRSGRLREKYAALWILVGTAVVVLVIWPELLGWVTGLLGIQVPSNLLFFLAIMLLLGVCLHLSLEISKLEGEARILAEEIAILRLRLERGGVGRDSGGKPPTLGDSGVM
ncbi:MAG TPA: DUF2304 domain-containing protein [Actinomycetaceae bacterium]|nr:DUF2304 domain-containing protein [Actinomycetaceae bacterium]